MKINIAVVRLSKGKKEVFTKEGVKLETTSPSGNFYYIEVKKINFHARYSVLNCVQFNESIVHCIGLLPAKELLEKVEKAMKDHFENNLKSAEEVINETKKKIELLNSPAVEFEKEEDEE